MASVRKTKEAVVKTATKQAATKAGSGEVSAAPDVAAKANASQAPAEEPMGEASAKPLKQKVKKPKLVRDSFAMPEVEYEVLRDLKKACMKAGVDIKKSELLRVGVALLKKQTPIEIETVLADLVPLKAGRPKKAA